MVVTRSKRKRSCVTSTTAPGKLEQALLEHLERRDVEIVGRLVEHQEIGRLEHERREWTRACSPPERRPTGMASCSGGNRKRRAQPATWIGWPPKTT